MIVLSHPTGNSNSREALRAFYDRGLLAKFFTTIAWNANHPIAQYLPQALRGELTRRTYDQIPSQLIQTHFSKELLRQIGMKTRLYPLYASEYAPFSVDSVYKDLDAYVAECLPKLRSVKAVYAYEDGAAVTFEKAKRLGIRRIYDLPIGYWRASRIVSEMEAAENPEWAQTLASLTDSTRKCAQKDEELNLADIVIVASQFTKKSLRMFPGYEQKRIVVVPYGAPRPSVRVKITSNSSNPLRVLYVGSLSQRKGLSYLAEAMSLVGRAAKLTLIGRSVLPLPKAVVTLLKEHQWIPSLSHPDLLEEMSRHDVLAFPSLFEGFGLVITEAISQGLPVITTSSTGGPDILRDGLDGFIVPTRSATAIAERIMQLAGDRDLLSRMSASALERASQLSWENYRSTLLDAVLSSSPLGV